VACKVICIHSCIWLN
jgi:hypothetical protein